MSRSTFTRLGDHIARDLAADVRKRAAAGDPEAIIEREKIDRMLTPDGLRWKAGEIVDQMLEHACAVLIERGYPAPEPPSPPPSPPEMGLFLETWAMAQRTDRDTLEGRMISVISLCSRALVECWDKPAALQGFIVGYGMAQEAYLALREYGDGPALARERELAKGRADGGKARKNAVKPLHDKIAAEFMAARRTNPRVSAKGWATKNAERVGLDPETVRKIAGAALKATKAPPDTP